VREATVPAPTPEEDMPPPEPAASLEADALFDEVVRELAGRGADVPRATYRVQLNRDFGFAALRAQLDYLDALGVSHVYASPFFRARAGSQHGYDLVDHNQLNPELGDEGDYEALCERQRALGLGTLLDFVPNHMGIGVRENAWWMDVLENGPSSLYAPAFDVAWRPLKAELENKVLLPILGDHYGRVLDGGQLAVRFEHGAFFVHYYDHVLPVNPRTYGRVLEPMLPELIEQLGPEDDALLELQSIITGVSHLPPRTESQRAKVVERRREKEILKRRLATLVAEQPLVAVALDRSLSRINGEPGRPESFDSLHSLLEEQAWRLSFWRVAAEEINYRRFFDINDLAAIRMEVPAVFAETHRLLFRLLAESRVDGLRIDHPDGLWAPVQYFRSLQRGYVLEKCRQRFLARAGHAPPEQQRARNQLFDQLRLQLGARFDAELGSDPTGARPLYVVVEKILSRGEPLPEDWPVHGTSGYDFATTVGGLFADGANERAITDVYERFIGARMDFDALVYQKKKLVLETSLASELNVLAHALNRLSERDRHSRDFTLGLLTDALREVIACFPVYRTYVYEGTDAPAEGDRIAIARAIRGAMQRNPAMDASIFRFVRSVLMLDFPPTAPREDQRLWREFVMRVQQLTGPVMAKGLEDTAFYVFNRLVSLNEVGGEP
jgi:(1->4)-alpha-D-glucan 1-alpha-D-glucosylmutase